MGSLREEGGGRNSTTRRRWNAGPAETVVSRVRMLASGRAPVKPCTITRAAG